MVVSAATKLPLANARIEPANTACWPSAKITVTDAQGEARLAPPEGCGFTATVTAEDCFPAVVHIESTESAKRLTIALAAAGTVTACVRDHDQRPVEGAYVDVDLANEQGSGPAGSFRPAFWPIFLPVDRTGQMARAPLHSLALTNSQGVYRTLALPCDTPLFLTAQSRGRVGAAAVSIPSDKRNALVNVNLVESTCASGRLLWDDGTPAMGVGVCLLEPDDRGAFPGPRVCKKDGHFELCGLKLGLNRWRVDLPAEYSRTIIADKPSIDLGTIILGRRYLLEIRLTAEPAAERNFSRFEMEVSHAGRLAGRTWVENNGSSAMRLPAGPAEIVVVRPEGVVAVARAEVPCEPVIIPVGDSLANLRIVSPPLTTATKFTLHMAVDTDESDGLRRARHSYVNIPSWSTTTPLVWQGNNLLVTMMVPGRYEIYLELGDDPPSRLGSAVLKAGETTDLVPVFGRPGSVDGLLVDGTGKPISDAQIVCALTVVDATEYHRQRLEVRTNAAGGFRFNTLSAGQWTVFPKSLGPLWQGAQNVYIGDGEEQKVELRSDGTGRIVGNVKNYRGLPLQTSVRVQLAGHPESQRGQTVCKSGKDGEFSFDVLAGTYEISSDYLDRGTPLSLMATINVAAGETKTVDLCPECGGTLFRVVRDGEPVNEWNGGIAFTEAGWCNPIPVDGSEGILRAQVSGAPCAVVVIGSKLTPILDPVRSPVLYELGYVSQLAGEGSVTAIAITGADVVVTSRTPGQAMPRMKVCSLGPVTTAFDTIDLWSVTYSDEGDGTRRFQRVPVGAVIELVSGVLGSEDLRQEVRIEARGEIHVAWPPQ